MKTYLLTVAQTPWRNAAVGARLAAAGVAAEPVYGVHGMTAGVAPVLPPCDSDAHLSPGKLSIAFSKMLAWQLIAERPDPWALVVENDVVLCDDFRAEFARSFAALPADWQVAHVGHCCAADKPTTVINDRVSEIRHPFCCHAVLWTRSAARVALAEFRRHSWGTASDIILARAVYPRLRHYSFTPPLAFQADLHESEAGSGGRWDTIPGWFDFARVYDEALGRVAGPAVFVEVGCWKGRSTAYLAEQVKRRLLPVTLYAVDTWRGTEAAGLAAEVRRDHGGDLYPAFERHMSRAGVWDWVTPVRAPSVAAAARFPDGSVDFVFIDADHEYPAVAADISAWTPKLKPGGVIAGHDIDLPGVRRAVAEAFPGRWRRWERTWLVDGGAPGE